MDNGMRLSDLDRCCTLVSLQMQELKLQPGREDWVRAEASIAALVDRIRDMWSEECSHGVNTMFPWRDDFVLCQFIRARKKRRSEQETFRSLFDAGSLWRGNDSGVVYALQNSLQHVKIGFTTRTADDRIKDMRTGQSEALRLIGEMPGSRDKEQAVLTRFAQYRIARGGGIEWHYPVPVLMEWIKEAMTCP